AIAGPNRAGVAVRHVDAAVGNANVVEKGDDFVPRNGFANRVTDLRSEAGGVFDAQACTPAQVQADLARVHRGKEIPPQDEDEASGGQAESKKHAGEAAGPLQNSVEGAAIGFAEALKAAFKSLLVATEKTLFFSGMLLGVVLVLF